MAFIDADSRHMLRALELAERGRGFVEPNPMVGCVIVKDGAVIGEGFHARFGGPHAEVAAIEAAGANAKGSSLYVTLEPCCHQGKTPPCTKAVIAAGVRRIVAAMQDPFAEVSGKGLAELREAGLEVEVGLHEDLARRLNGPYLKLLSTGKPWVIAKWAMTLDGKIATRSGYSKWISGSAAREVVQSLRSRVDAIVVGRRTAEMDDPLLTARPDSGTPARIATRVVVSSQARLSPESQLIKTAKDIPVLLACGPEAQKRDIRRLAGKGVEVLPFLAETRYERTLQLLDELGRRRMTNILVEGGSQLFGTLLDARQIDEVHLFIAPKIFGGEKAPSPIGGAGINDIATAIRLQDMQVKPLGNDLYLHGLTESAPNSLLPRLAANR
ncbi:MAG: bifunctional diaminohydroxyphosphoribosylaminopyrimidine deaminase/5-amino-6-(5-phosphoribosylamino)uracil reductase RibD [Planctomycetales bacterium]|nr:bifunctional diaminohydroxyphosphoribosylaminopyrimidine deaminase/5-amino-6-(5-phosphoribosylamino)uracil reductase RibD [Planctomycetales bacterium]